MIEKISRPLEKYFSPRELCYLLGFADKFWRERAQAGDFTLTTADDRGNQVTVCEPLEIAGELRIPQTGVNAWLARHPYRYDAGIRARNAGELRRKLAKTAEPATA